MKTKKFSFLSLYVANKSARLLPLTMYTVTPTKAYRKSLKKLARSGNFDVLEVDRLINILATRAWIDPKYSNHPLHGEYAGCFECHLKGNFLLIYSIDEVGKIVTIVNVGSHSELFG